MSYFNAEATEIRRGPQRKSKLGHSPPFMSDKKLLAVAMLSKIFNFKILLAAAMVALRSNCLLTG